MLAHLKKIEWLCCCQGPVAYAHRQRSVALRAKTEQPAEADACASCRAIGDNNVSENPDGRPDTSSQLADESWAPVAHGHLGARVRSISAPCSSAYSWLRIPVLPVVLDRSPARVGLGQRWVRYSAPFPGTRVNST